MTPQKLRRESLWLQKFSVVKEFFSLPFSKQVQFTLRTDYELLFQKYSIAFLVLLFDSRYSKMIPKLVKQKSHSLYPSIRFANPVCGIICCFVLFFFSESRSGIVCAGVWSATIWWQYFAKFTLTCPRREIQNTVFYVHRYDVMGDFFRSKGQCHERFVTLNSYPWKLLASCFSLSVPRLSTFKISKRHGVKCWKTNSTLEMFCQ